MSMTASQAAAWKQIAAAYAHYCPAQDALMPVTELHARLPHLNAEAIGEALAQAAADGLAEVGATGETPLFRPLPAGAGA